MKSVLRTSVSLVHRAPPSLPCTPCRACWRSVASVTQGPVSIEADGKRPWQEPVCSWQEYDGGFFPVVSVVKNFQIEHMSHSVESGRIKSRLLSRLAPSSLAPSPLAPSPFRLSSFPQEATANTSFTRSSSWNPQRLRWFLHHISWTFYPWELISTQTLTILNRPLLFLETVAFWFILTVCMYTNILAIIF